MIQNAVLSALALLSTLLGSALPAQKTKVDIKYLVPEKIERATKTDDAGLVQWAPHAQQKCPTCAGTGTTGCAHCDPIEGNIRCLECGLKKTAPCRSCGGSGNILDPLEKALCPSCMGAGAITCAVCGGRGHTKVEGGGDKDKDCLGCKNDGGFPCTTCKGTRLVEAPALKPSVAEAPLVALTKARDAIDATLKGLGMYTVSPKNTRKSVKEYVALLAPATSVLPPLKRAQATTDEVMQRVLKGEQWVGHEEREAAAINQLKAANEYYLKFEKRLLELCIARAEANQKTLAEKKGTEKKEPEKKAPEKKED
jgi:hypothetical protein